MSGVGIIEETRFQASSDPSISYIENPDSLETHEVPPPSRALSSIFFHDVCWRLLLARLSGDTRAGTCQLDPLHVGRHLLYLLHCFPHDCYGGLLTRHDYGGASQFRKSYLYARGGYERSLPDEWQFLLADPMVDITGITDMSSTMLLNSYQSRKDLQQISAEDPFGYLPAEILDILFIKLTSTDLCSLRLASRVVAGASSPAWLSQAFWRSRFSVHHEMGFFLGGQRQSISRISIDWHRLYAFLQESLAGNNNNSTFCGLLNKRRIWNGLSSLCASLRPLLEASTCGIPTPLEVPFPEGYQRGAFIRSHTPPTPFRQNHVVLLPSWPLRLSISFINFNCRRYVSGISLRGHDGRDWRIPQFGQAGLVIPTAEEHLDLSSPEAIKSIKIYSIDDGIVGIEFHKEARGLKPGLVGSASNPDTAVAELVPGVSGGVRGFTLTFDVWTYSLFPLYAYTLTYLTRRANAFLLGSLSLPLRALV